jgi:hypothetical protein
MTSVDPMRSYLEYAMYLHLVVILLPTYVCISPFISFTSGEVSNLVQSTLQLNIWNNNLVCYTVDYIP